MSKGKEKEPTGESLLTRLVDQAREKYLEQESYIDIKRGQVIADPYCTYMACKDVINESGLDPVCLLPQLVRFTTFTPFNCLFLLQGAIDKESTWETFYYEIVENILSHELEKRYPEIEQEESRRLEKYGEV